VQIYKSFLTCLILTLFLLVPIVFSQDSINVDLVGRWAHGPCYAADVEGDYAYIGNGGAFQVLDVSTVDDPQLVAEINLSNTIHNLVLHGNHVYLVDRDHIFHVFDISNPGSPIEVGVHQLPFSTANLVVQNGYAYIGDTTHGLRIIDISNLSAMSEAGSIPDIEVRDIAIKNKYIFIAGGSEGFRIIDSSNLPNLPEIGFLPGFTNLVRIQDNFAYIHTSNGIQIVSIANPTSPTPLGLYNNPGSAHEICVTANYLFLNEYYNDGSEYYYWLRAIDISDPDNPLQIAYLNPSWYVHNMEVNNGHIFVSTGAAGLQILNAVDITELWNSDISNLCAITVEGNYAYLAQMGYPGSLSIFNITNPVNPVETGTCELNSSDRLHAIEVEGQYAYVAHGQGGVFIFDISDTAAPSEVGMFRDGSDCFDVAVEGNYAFIVGWDHTTYTDGLLIVDISDRVAPILELTLGRAFSYGIDTRDGYAYVAADSGLYIFDISTPLSTYQVSVNFEPSGGRDIVLKGSEAYIATENGLYVMDISDPANPVSIGYYDSGYTSTLEVRGNIAYLPVGNSDIQLLDVSDPSSTEEIGHVDTPGGSRNVTINENYAYVADEGGGLRIINITDPANPFETGFLDTMTYNVEIAGNYAYVGGENGLHIIDISIPSSPSQIGYFETFGMVSDVAVRGNLAYLSGGSGNNYFIIIDISNPADPSEVDRISARGGDVAITGNYAYLARGTYGLYVYDISDSSNIVEMANYSGYANDIDIVGDYACIAGGMDGLRLYNISDPENLIEEGYFDTGYTFGSVNIHDAHIYITDGYNGIFLFQEKIPPLAPSKITAGGSSPSPFQNTPYFELNWLNPGDLSGIGQAKYKIGSPPSSNDDYDRILPGAPPQNTLITEEGNQILYVWLIDNAGNEDYNHYDTVTVRYDHSAIPPSNFEESNGASDNVWQNAINNPTFTWSGPSDFSGIIDYNIYFGPNANDTIRTDSTSSTYYTITASEGISYFRIQARDRVDNLSDWTTGFTFKYDITKPEGTGVSSPDTAGGVFEVSWSGGSDGDGSGLNGNYDIRFRDGNGSWIDWLTEFTGDHAEFVIGEVGHTYYFEAAARDSAGNIEDFSGQPEDTTFIGSYLGFTISQIEGEHSDSIEFNYTISNSESTATDIKCEYSLASDSLWNLATINGITTNLLPENYRGSIIWNSYADEPGIDLETVRFKITPSDNNGTGLSDFTPPFHLDNNRIPLVYIDPMDDEQGENVSISYQLSDVEQDTLSIICEFFHPDNKSWQSATVTGNLSMILKENYDDSITWNSVADFPDGLGYYLFRIKPFDNDLGISDTDSIYVDNVGAPEVISLSGFSEEQSGNIPVDYELFDEEGELINLDCQYSANSGGDWFTASVSGNLANISPSNYSGSLIWQSTVDLPGVDKTSVRFSITPFNDYEGRSRETTDFHLDNNVPPSLQIGTIISPQAGMIKIPITVNDIEEDTIHISGMYALADKSWKRLQFQGAATVTADDYDDALYWNSHTDLPFNEFKQVQIQLCPMDIDSGTYSLSTLFDIHNYPGDYTGDIQIDSEDLVPFALAWHQQDLEKEIGPATGSPPLLKPEPDNKIDFEDLMVLVQQWNWSYDNPLDAFTKPLSSGNDTKSEISLISKEKVNQKTEYIWNRELKLPPEGQTLSPQKPQLISVEQSDYDQWANEFADELVFSIDSLTSILSIQIEMNYQPDIFSFKDIDNILLKDQNGFTFKADDKKNGRIIFSTVVLEANNPPIEIRDDLLRFTIDVRKDSHFPLDYRWKIYGEEGQLITQGQANFDLETHRTTPAEYSLYQNYPNPFNPSTTIRYQLPVDGKVRMDIFNILGERVETLINETQKAGYYSPVWDISKNTFSIASGIYFVRLMAWGNDGSRYLNHKKLVCLK
jgi:hypothetical protein